MSAPPRDTAGVSPQPSPLREIPRTVWALGFVSMFMDISSEMIHALLPLYLASVLGASTVAIGLIEGIAESTANISKVFSGALSDWLGRRKLLVGIGYGLGAVTKPVFAVAQSLEWVVGARFVDRLGKGIRGAPRDALIADVTPPALRGASFGLRQSLDTVGALLGPVLAVAFMFLTGSDFQKVFWIATIPAVAAVSVLIVGVREPDGLGRTTSRAPPTLADLSAMGRPFWGVVAVGGLLTLARFSEAFLVLRAQAAGIDLALVPLALGLMSAAYALSAYPAGAASDRIGQRPVMAAGIVFLILADLALALAPGMPGVVIGVILWGLHMGFTQGLLAALVSEVAPERLRGSAFGIFNLVLGVAMLLASVIAGGLWELYGFRATFLAGAAFTGLSLAGLGLVWARERTRLA